MTESSASPDGLFQIGVKAHKLKKWDEAKEKYNAALESQPNPKIEKKIRQNIALLEAGLKPQGEFGHLASRFIVYSTLTFFVLLFLSLELAFSILAIGYLIGVVFAFLSLFQRGQANRMNGVLVICVFCAVFYAIYSYTTNLNKIYPARARISEGMMMAQVFRNSIDDYFHENNALPDTNSDVGLDAPDMYSNNFVSNITVGEEGRIIIKYQGGVFDGQTIIYIPTIVQEGLLWDCTKGSLSEELRPLTCRNR